jgi:hypothetical protein
MNSELRTCNCSNEGFALDCPQVFFQDGKPLHVLKPDEQPKPRLYCRPNETASHLGNQNDPYASNTNGDDLYVPPLLADGNRHQKALKELRSEMQKQVLGADDSSSSSVDDYFIEREHKTVQRNFSNYVQQQTSPARHGRGQLVDDSMMMEQNREFLRKFEALKIGNESLTGMTIGGYAVDLSKAAQKAKEVAPLPPSKLPKIFKEDDMNFYHHFIQGMEILMGTEVLDEIVETTHFFKKTELLLFPLIEGMILAGYQRTDNEITIFTKKVLTSTFELDAANEHNKDSKSLIVAANLWGLQYIEPGLEMKEADLKMWLSVNYNHYKTLWFNTFKSAGIPSFALGGVQTRYEGPAKAIQEEPMQYSDDPMKAVVQVTAGIMGAYAKEEKKRKSDRHGGHRGKSHRSTRSPESVMGSIFNGKK